METYIESLESPFELRPPFTAERPEGSGTYVRITDDIRRSVVFIGTAEGGKTFKALGTGFLVIDEPSETIYVVTAAHVVFPDYEDSPIAIRFNGKDGKAHLDSVEIAKWHTHPTDTAVDIAVMEWEPPSNADISPWITKWMISDFKRKTKNIGHGDLAYIVGMYFYIQGGNRVSPIVHTGHIAAMGDHGEKIPARNWRNPSSRKPVDVEGYLIEAQTLKGLSGSPVFVRRSIKTIVADKSDLLLHSKNPKQAMPALDAYVHGSLWLLGLWKGAWFGEPTKGKQITGDGKVVVPVGMGVAVPAIKIQEVLNQDSLRTRRENKLAAARGALVPEDTGIAVKSAAVIRDEMIGAMLHMPAKPRTPPAPKKFRRK